MFPSGMETLSVLKQTEENCNHHCQIDDIVEKEHGRKKTGGTVENHNHHRRIDDIVEKEKDGKNDTTGTKRIVEKEKDGQNDATGTRAAVENCNQHRQFDGRIDDIVEKEKNGKTGAAVGNRTHHRDDPQLIEARGTLFDRDNPPIIQDQHH